MKKHTKPILLLVIISVFLICRNMNILAEPQSMLDDDDYRLLSNNCTHSEIGERYVRYV